MLPNATSSAPVQRDSTSPSSPDLTDTKAPHTSDLSKRPVDSSFDPRRAPPKRQKRDADSNTGLPHGPSETKNEDNPPLSKYATMVHDAAKSAWEQLCASQLDRHDFTQKDIVNAAVEKLSQLPCPEKSVSRIKRELAKYFRKAAMFKKSNRPDAPPDCYVMANPSFIAQPSKSTRAREAAKKADAKKAVPQATNDAEEEVTFAGVVTQPEQTIPEEWVKEAYRPVRLSTFDKSNGITFVGDEKNNRVKGFKGYRMIRGTSGVLEGDWYYECTIMPSEKGHCRLGWTLRRSEVETPVGFDAYGFGIRDLTGEFVYRARPKRYGQPFGPGDVIGCRIVLPALSEEQQKAVSEAEKRWLDYRFLSFCQGQQPADSGVDLSPHGKVEFFKNGKSMGVPEFFTKPQPTPFRKTERREGEAHYHANFKGRQAGKDEGGPDDRKVMKGGVYYPSISLFEDAEVEVNFGPHFRFDLPTGSKPMCDAAREAPPPAPPSLPPIDADGKRTKDGDGKAVGADGGTEDRGQDQGGFNKQGGPKVGGTAQGGRAEDIQGQIEVKNSELAQGSSSAPKELATVAAKSTAPASECVSNKQRHSNAAGDLKSAGEAPRPSIGKGEEGG